MYKKIAIIIVLSIVSLEISAQSFKTIFPFKTTDGKWGYCDAANKVILPPAYKYAELHKYGFAKVINQNDQQGLINDKGEFIIPFGNYIVSTGKNESVFKPTNSYYGSTPSHIRDNVFVVIKEKERLWYNGKGELLFTDNFNYELSMVKYSNNDYDAFAYDGMSAYTNNNSSTAKLNKYYYLLSNEEDEKITIINSDGQLLIKAIEAYKAEIKSIYIGETEYDYFALYKGELKEESSDYTGYNYDNYRYKDEYGYGYGNYETRENIKCQLIDAEGKVIIPFSRGLASIDNIKTSYYSSASFEEGYLLIGEMIHESADCEPKLQYGLFALGSKKEVIRPSFDSQSFMGNVYEQQPYDPNYSSEADKAVLKVINSNQKFNSFKEMVLQFKTIYEKTEMTEIDENATEENNGFKGIFTAFTKNEKTIFFKVDKDDVQVFKQLDESISVTSMFYEKGIYYCYFSGDYQYVYNLSNGEKVKRYGNKEENNTKDYLKGSKLELVQVEGGMYNIKDKKGNTVTNDFSEYGVYNKEQKILQIYNGEKYALVNLNENKPVIYDYYLVVEPYPEYGAMEYWVNDGYDLNELVDDFAVGNNGINGPTENWKRKNNYPRIVVNDYGFGVLNDKAEELIPIQDRVLIFEDFGTTKMIGVYQLKASVAHDKKNIGYYSLDGTPYFE